MQQCAWTGYLLDDLVGRRKHGRRQCEAERNGSLEIDNELELSGLYHWKVSRFFPVKDASGVDTRLAIHPSDARPIAQQETGGGEFSRLGEHGQGVPRRQR